MKNTHRIPRQLHCFSWLLALTFSSVGNSQDNKFQGIQVQKPEIQVQTIEEIVVTAQRRQGLLDDLDREYKSVDGKRIFEGPHGELRFILAIGQEIKNQGEMKRIMSRRITMPVDFPGSSLNRYKYPIAHECGIDKFQLFDGGEFMALGYEMKSSGRTEVLFDVMIGGGPFSSPGLWGPYDQVLGRRHKMELIMGDAQSDGMGLMKSGYAVGMKADMPTYELMDLGDIYSSAVNATGKCLSDKLNIDAAKNFLSKN
ncbi:MAG: hypothetical protein ACI9XC_001706 [Gammaproteobacteria bacterium]|jgi:hypothetical protein